MLRRIPSGLVCFTYAMDHTLPDSPSLFSVVSHMGILTLSCYLVTLQTLIFFHVARYLAPSLGISSTCRLLVFDITTALPWMLTPTYGTPWTLQHAVPHSVRRMLRHAIRHVLRHTNLTKLHAFCRVQQDVCRRAQLGYDRWYKFIRIAGNSSQLTDHGQRASENTSRSSVKLRTALS